MEGEKWLADFLFRADFRRAAGDVTESDSFKYKNEYVIHGCSLNIYSFNHINKIYNIHTIYMLSEYRQYNTCTGYALTTRTINTRGLDLWVRAVLFAPGAV